MIDQTVAHEDQQRRADKIGQGAELLQHLHLSFEHVGREWDLREFRLASKDTRLQCVLARLAGSSGITERERLRHCEYDDAVPKVNTAPEHHLENQFGQFPTVAEMTRIGSTTVVLASGALAEVSVGRITASAASASV